VGLIPRDLVDRLGTDAGDKIKDGKTKAEITLKKAR
jgi:hypothetical protein